MSLEFAISGDDVVKLLSYKNGSVFLNNPSSG